MHKGMAMETAGGQKWTGTQRRRSRVPRHRKDRREALVADVDSVVESFTARVAAPIAPAALDTLRAEVLELARLHAARTILETAAAHHVATRRRRPWGRRP